MSIGKRPKIDNLLKKEVAKLKLPPLIPEKEDTDIILSRLISGSGIKRKKKKL